ncbi:hypothetical protein MYAM1_003308 [Malassezia yamatoensis]|uniref:Uncharacterized protein n=1 Tax=Malassezia yamatoensis TaxID=253288 RepID=A0AAJ6CJA6_9BASI|nr:hypothetical protein MYAM1_003308 [Malassezia yamatoensis]
MYVVAPASSVRWLNLPLNAFRGEHWSSPKLLAQALDSSYTMIPPELRHSLLHRAGDSASRWSLAALATATMVTSAMALYYYVPWGQLEINMETLLASIGEEGFGMNHAYSAECFDEMDMDDDEHIDPELLDGFQAHDKESRMSVVLTSSDPTSDLCHNPIIVNLCGSSGEKSVDPALSRRSLSSVSTQPPTPSEMNSPRRGSMPSILRRDSQSFPSSLTQSPVLSASNSSSLLRRLNGCSSQSNSPNTLSSLLPSTLTCDSALSSTSDSCISSLSSPTKSDCSGTTSPRSIKLTEPDWKPFTDSHDRARKRVAIASIANAISELHSEHSSPVAKSKQLPLLKALPIEPPAELGEGSEFRFEKFTRSTAAAGRNWDWRRRSSCELLEALDEDVLVALEKLNSELDNDLETNDVPVSPQSPQWKSQSPRLVSPRSPLLPASFQSPPVRSDNTDVFSDESCLRQSRKHNTSNTQRLSLSRSNSLDAAAESVKDLGLNREPVLTPTKRKFGYDQDKSHSTSVLSSSEPAVSISRPRSATYSAATSAYSHVVSSPKRGSSNSSPSSNRILASRRRFNENIRPDSVLNLVDI